MRKPICWTEKLPERIRREVRVSISGGKLKWQSKRSDEESWDYTSPPSEDDWANLTMHAEAWYRRKRMPFEALQLIKKLRP